MLENYSFEKKKKEKEEKKCLTVSFSSPRKIITKLL